MNTVCGRAHGAVLQPSACSALAFKVLSRSAFPTGLRKTMLSKEDRGLIKMLRAERGYDAERLVTEFPSKTIGLLLHKIDTTGSADGKTTGPGLFSVQFYTKVQF